MSAPAKSNKQSMRPMWIALSVIVIAVAGFYFFNRSETNGHNSSSADRIVSDSEAKGALVMTSGNFDETISKGVVLVDFWATWCAPCRIQGPIVDELAKDMAGKAVISKLDVDDYRELAMRYQVTGIPTLIIFKDGQAVRRFVGVQQKETLAAAINELL